MKSFFFSLFVLIYINGDAQQAMSSMDSLMQTYAKQYQFNGTVLVAQKGKPLFQKGYGNADVKSKVPNSANSIFQLGSLTKQFTAVAILKLQEEGKLSVQDHLSKYYPDYPNGNSITIENLLTHTSGIYNYTENRDFIINKVATPHTEQSMLALFRDKPLDFEPGTKYNYSNSAYLLLGYIIQKVTGKAYEQVIREFIFSPLQMDNTGFDFTHLRSPQKATGYFFINADSSLLAPIVDSTVSYSAGAMYSTIGDLLKWDRAIAEGRIISRKSWKAAFTPFKNNYGYGWSMDTVNSRPVVSHGGGIHGFTTYMARYPEDDIVVILLTNSGTKDLAKISGQLGALALGKPLKAEKERKEITVPVSVLNEYVGEYALTPAFSITVRVENGKLMGQATGQSAFELFAETSTSFFLKVVDARVEFLKDNSGKTEKLVLYQNGQRLEGMKK